MGLTAGTKVGPYEIQDKLGEGGMGEVYRARDTRLDRTVAIKILSSHLASNPDLKVRFQREARAISALQHPHICVLHDVGSQDDVDYLVMEFLEGETLAERLRKGALPIDQLVKIGVQIAGALDKAHRAGIVHRDLKPGNIMLTKTGAKLLDFGLAKSAAVAALSSSPPGSAAPPLSAALTMSSPSPHNSPLTSAGSVVGTMQYMSPEQLQGKEADARTDIFAFGAVLYEMATGHRAFSGKSQLSVATAILENDPAPVSSVKPGLPPALDAVVASCLAKNPDERFASAHDVGIALKWVGEAAVAPVSPPAVGGQRPPLQKAAWALAAILLLLLAVTALGYWRLRHQPQPRVVRSFLIPPDKADPNGNAGYSAMSPDGARWAVVAPDVTGAPVLYIRPLNSLTAQALAGTEDALDPFWSPDSRSVAFWAQGKLKRIDASGGPAQTICDAPVGRGGSWSQGGTIVYKLAGPPTLLRVQAQGGTPVAASELDASQQEDFHRWPWFLPDGRHYIFFVHSQSTDHTGIALGSLDNKQHRFLFRNDSNAVYASGYLVFVSGGYLLAQKFEADRLELVGEAVRIAENVTASLRNYHGTFAASQTGTLLYFRGAGNGSQLVLRNRRGKPLGVSGPPARYVWPRVSPDGRQVAVGIEDDTGKADIWLLSFERGTRTRLTFDPGSVENPVWSPDGTKIYYASTRSGLSHIYAKLANGAGTEEMILNTSGSTEYPMDISPDGLYLAYDRTEGMRRGIWILPLFGDRKPFPLVQTDFPAVAPKFSPDGKFVAYLGIETGNWEVYITPFPGGGAKWQVSEHGGNVPVWRGDGKELYYQSGNDLVAVEVRESGAGVELGNPQRLFGVSTVSGPNGPYELVARDGSKFLINAVPELSTPDPPVLITNWPEELKGSRQ
jgi:Tol biopolymer transport system component